MISDIYLPWKVDEKLKNRFLKRTYRLGEYEEFEGFVVNLPSRRSQEMKDVLWPKLSPIIRDFGILAVTPFPSENFPILPLVVPYWIKISGKTGIVKGCIRDLSEFSSLAGRFLIVEEFEKIPVEKYLILEKTGLDGRKIYKIFDESFAERARDVMLSYFISSSPYLNRVGGCAITFVDSGTKYYYNNFSEFERSLKLVSPILRKNRFKIQLKYADNFEIDTSITPNMKIRYAMIKSNEAKKFYYSRKANLWEKSAVTKGDIRRHELINLAEIPYLGTKEERVVGDEFVEYGVDIASFVIQRHLQESTMNEDFVERRKEKFLRIVDSEFPILSEAMRLGIIVDIANINGFGEHLARLLNGWNRIGMAGRVEDLYISILERINDVMQDKLRLEISALGEKKRLERIINRVLWELNILRPDGWSYDYFTKKMNERGMEDRADKIFQDLVRMGCVIMKKKGVYKAVASL